MAEGAGRAGGGAAAGGEPPLSGLRVAVFCATGQLGQDLVLALADHQVLALAHDQADVTDAGAVARVLEPFRPDWVVTAAALHDVDRCEDEPERALRVNALGALHVARAAHRLGARTLYVSTDYVFSGKKGSPYLESDLPDPVNAYGASKLAGEAMVGAAAGPGSLVVRASGLYGRHPCRGKAGRNFVELMLRLGRERGSVRVVDDETVSPTSTAHLARAMAGAIAAGTAGVLHLAAAGHCTWLEFARAIFEEAGMAVEVARAGPGEFPRKAPRPAFSPLASARVAREGLEPLPHWRDGLGTYLLGRRSDG